MCAPTKMVAVTKTTTGVESPLPLTRRMRRALVAGLAAVALGSVVSGCSHPGPGAANGPFTVWDPYQQYGSSSVWAQLLTECANANGAGIKRESYPATSLAAKVAAAQSQGQAPDILIAANQDVPTLADDHLLAPTSVTHLDTSTVQPDLLAVGQVEGSTYGTPVGVDTLALYYNKAILTAAGVAPSSITDWATLNAALAKIKAAGRVGITFAAAADDDASTQFGPWLWGAGGTLTNLSAPPAVAALNLLSGWSKNDLASDAVAQDTQDASWAQFAAGGTAFAESDAAHASAPAKLGFAYGVIPISTEQGGPAASPIVGESITIPTQQGAYRYAIDDKIIACLQAPGIAQITDSGLGYIGATTAVQDAQLKQTPALAPFVTAARLGKPQTADGVGSRYRQISQSLSTTVHAAVTGSPPN
jgi:multiple sugar transport system substrate-binding protein